MAKQLEAFEPVQVRYPWDKWTNGAMTLHSQTETITTQADFDQFRENLDRHSAPPLPRETRLPADCEVVASVNGDDRRVDLVFVKDGAIECVVSAPLSDREQFAQRVTAALKKWAS